MTEEELRLLEQVRGGGWLLTGVVPRELLGLILRPEEGGHDGSEGGRDENGEDAVSEPPSVSFQDTLGDLRSDEGVDDVGHSGETLGKPSPSKGGDVGEDYDSEKLETAKTAEGVNFGPNRAPSSIQDGKGFNLPSVTERIDDVSRSQHS